MIVYRLFLTINVKNMYKLDELPIVFYNENGHLPKLRIDQ